MATQIPGVVFNPTFANRTGPLTTSTISELYSLSDPLFGKTPPTPPTVKAGTLIECRQPLSVISRDGEDSTVLPANQCTAGSCKLVKRPNKFFALQDCAVNDKGEIVYTFLVQLGNTTPAGQAAGVQLQWLKGDGTLLPPLGPKSPPETPWTSGLFVTTFLVQIK